MKIKSTIIVLAFIVSALISCTKANNNGPTPIIISGNNNNNNNSTQSYSFSAVINQIQFYGVSPAALNSNGTITVTGFNGANTTITIAFPSSSVINSNYDSASGVVETYVSNNVHYITTGKTVALRLSTITSTSITGTFSFTCINPGNKTQTVGITGGSFYVPLN